MIYENSIIQLLHSDNKQNRLIRVCWISNDLQNLIVIDITDFKNVDFPYFVKMEDLLNDFEESRAKKIDFEPDLHIINPSEEYLMKYADKLNMKWKLIEELVSTEPAIYIPEERWKLLEELTAKTGVQANVIYDLLKRYWFYGKTINGLLPNYFDCGAKGESRHIFRLCLLFWRNQHGELI
jgi:hypothetical protein